MKKLPIDIKQKWVAALRSGDYKQGRGYLRTIDNEYCSLGVLCDLSDVAWVECALFYTLPSGRSGSVNSGDIDATVYDVLSQYVDMFDRVCRLSYHFITMNDKKRLSFEQIADWIDVNL